MDQQKNKQPKVKEAAETTQAKRKHLPWKVVLLILAVVALLGLIGPIYVVLATKNDTVSEEDISSLGFREVAIVFGAGVDPDRTPTPFLQARLETAAELYKQGKVKKVLLTGDNRAENYNEPYVMRETVISLGVPKADAVADFAGLGTYDSCYRAKHIFGVNSAFVVTQGYHLPRVVYTCSKLGIDSIGVGTSRYWHNYGRLVYPNYSFRELFSINKALFQLHITQPKAAILGQPEPISVF